MRVAGFRGCAEVVGAYIQRVERRSARGSLLTVSPVIAPKRMCGASYHEGGSSAYLRAYRGLQQPIDDLRDTLVEHRQKIIHKKYIYGERVSNPPNNKRVTVTLFTAARMRQFPNTRPSRRTRRCTRAPFLTNNSSTGWCHREGRYKRRYLATDGSARIRANVN